MPAVVLGVIMIDLETLILYSRSPELVSEEHSYFINLIIISNKFFTKIAMCQPNNYKQELELFHLSLS